jgi:amidophosphoribosyltransferase
MEYVMCGIAGAIGVPDAAYTVSLMLKALQHRGQEAAGIVSSHDGQFLRRRGWGLVDEVFAHVNIKQELPGQSAIGHVRYQTAGKSDQKSLQEIQPFRGQSQHGHLAIAVNGNLTNYQPLRDALLQKGATLQSHSDSELFMPLVSLSRRPSSWERLAEAVLLTEGASSVLLLDDQGLHAAVDPFGFRPLVWASYQDGWLFASETSAFDIFSVAKSAAIKPGHVVTATKDLVEERCFAWSKTTRQCSFCHVYFNRPDSVVFGQSSYLVRERLGRNLAAEAPAAADLVLAVPDSSNVMALAYAQALGVPFSFGLIRSHYMGRTFITPKQEARELGVRLKLNAVRALIAGKRVVVVDDSLVRGTTARRISQMLRDAGATEVHMRLASPPVTHPCRWGIDTPKRQQLLAARVDSADMARHLGVDSLGYLSRAGLLAAMNDPNGEQHCTSCFTGIHPTEGLPKPTSFLP